MSPFHTYHVYRPLYSFGGGGGGEGCTSDGSSTCHTYVVVASPLTTHIIPYIVEYSTQMERRTGSSLVHAGRGDGVGTLSTPVRCVCVYYMCVCLFDDATTMCTTPSSKHPAVIARVFLATSDTRYDATHYTPSLLPHLPWGSRFRFEI